jgi:hypothetical protein
VGESPRVGRQTRRESYHSRGWNDRPVVTHLHAAGPAKPTFFTLFQPVWSDRPTVVARFEWFGTRDAFVIAGVSVRGGITWRNQSGDRYFLAAVIPNSVRGFFVSSFLFFSFRGE